MDNIKNNIATIVECGDIASFLQKLKKNGLLIYEEGLNLDKDVLIVHNPLFVNDDRRYDMVVSNLEDNEKKIAEFKILSNVEFQECFIKSKNILISLSIDEKEKIQKKANSLNLSSSDLLYFIGTNIKGLENSDLVLDKRKENIKGSSKTTISLRVNSIDKDLFVEKANKYNMNISEFFIVSALNFEFKLILSKIKTK